MSYEYELVENPEDVPLANVPSANWRDIYLVKQLPPQLLLWVKDKKMERDAWLKEREKKTVTGSIANQYLAQGDIYAYPIKHYKEAEDLAERYRIPCNEVIMEKANLKTNAFTGNLFTRHGVKYESVAIQYYAKTLVIPARHKLIILPGEECFDLIDHPAFPWISASPDGIAVIVDEDYVFKEMFLLEAKNVWSAPTKNSHDDKAKYFTQLQILMEILNIEKAHLIQCHIPYTLVKDAVSKKQYRKFEHDFTQMESGKHPGKFIFAVSEFGRERLWFSNVFLPCAYDAHRRIHDLKMGYPDADLRTKEMDTMLPKTSMLIQDPYPFTNLVWIFGTTRAHQSTDGSAIRARFRQ
jgi:hypothetical protein